MTSEPSDRQPTPYELEHIAAEVAGHGAALVRAEVGSASLAGTKSSATDAVTHVDIRAEQLIRHELATRCPGSSIVGEELGPEDGSNEIGWIVDPIDGTVNFLYDLPVVSVSIAATVRGDVVAGAVADVLREETYSASVGSGARRDDHPITANDSDELALSLVATGFSYDSSRRAEQAETVGRLLPLARDIRCMGSAALNLCWVACGRLDAYYELDLKIYDYAAGAFIAAQAGAAVSIPERHADLLVAAAPRLSESLLAVIGEGS